MRKLIILAFLFLSTLGFSQSPMIALVSVSTDASPVIPPIPQVGTPILSDFIVNNATPSHIDFTATGDISLLTDQGFIVSGKTVDSINVVSNYFIVNTPFTFWDNNTIRLESGNGIVNDFPLQYIQNNINEPSTTITKYAKPTGTGTQDGDTEVNAWSYTYAGVNAAPGTLVKMLAGTQSTELVISVSGTPTAPIVFEGYNNAAKNVLVTRTPGLVFDATIMPLITNKLNVAGTSEVVYKSNLIFRNIQVQPPNDGVNGVTIDYNHNILLDNIYVTEAFNGYFGLFSHTIFNLRINRSFVSNCSNQGTNVSTVNTLFNDLYAASSYAKGMDYYINIMGCQPTETSNSIIRNCYVERFPTDAHPGHGISLKANSSGTTDREVEYTLVEDSEVRSTEMSIELRHTKVQNNVIRNVSVTYDDAATATRNIGAVQVTSARNNIVEDCDFDCEWGVRFLTSSEDLAATDAGNNNTFRNNIFRNSHTEYGNFVAWFYADTVPGENPPNDNQWINNTFDNFDYMNYNSVLGIGTGNVMTNNIINDVTIEIGGNGAIVNTYTNNLIWGSWATSIGTGSVNINPSFTIDYEPTATFSTIRKVPISGVEYDKNGLERNATLTTVGAVLHGDETP